MAALSVIRRRLNVIGQQRAFDAPRAFVLARLGDPLNRQGY